MWTPKLEPTSIFFGRNSLILNHHHLEWPNPAAEFWPQPTTISMTINPKNPWRILHEWKGGRTCITQRYFFGGGSSKCFAMFEGEKSDSVGKKHLKVEISRWAFASPGLSALDCPEWPNSWRPSHNLAKTSQMAVFGWTWEGSGSKKTYTPED